MTGPRIRAKRIYEAVGPDDGLRVLVDRLWPRGVSRDGAAIDLWLKELAPSNELRRWYGHVPERAEEFARRYRIELEGHPGELGELRRRSRGRTVTLLFAARSFSGSNAEVVLGLLRERPRPGTRADPHPGVLHRGHLRPARRSGRNPTSPRGPVRVKGRQGKART